MTHTHGKHPLDFFNLGEEFNELHFHNIIQNFALALVSVFVPIYLLKMNYSLSNVLLFYTIYFFSFGLFSFLTFLIPEVGFKRIMMLRPLGLITYLSWLYLLGSFPNTLYYLAVFNGFCSAFYWVAFHYFMSGKVNEKSVNDGVGLLFALPKLFRIFSPLLGALVLIFFSYEVLFLLASVLLIVSVFPLLHLEEEMFIFDVNFKKFFTKDFWKYFFGFCGDGVNYAVLYIFLPLFIYLSFSQTLNVGIFSSVLGLASGIAPIFIAQVSEEDNSKFIRLGSLLHAVLFSLIFFLDSSIAFFVFGFVMGLVSYLWTVPFYSKMYEYAETTNTLAFFIMREVFLNLSRTVVVFLVYYFNDFSIGFVSEILSRLFFLLF